MIHRLARGELPRKPHTVFEPGGELAFEHCFTRQGFDGTFTIMYHAKPPHWVEAEEALGPHPGLGTPIEDRTPLRRHFLGGKVPAGGSQFMARKRVLVNPDIDAWLVHPDRDDETLVANGDADELFFVDKGSGWVDTPLGTLRFETQDYVYIPRTLPYRFRLDGPCTFFISEAKSYLDVPSQFRTAAGQLRMDAPYTHRDFREPEWPEGGPTTLGAPRRIVIKRRDHLTAMDMKHDPFDVVGWDGTMWPFAFAIRDFQPKTSSVHLPPTIHMTFAGGGFIVCSFVPRVVDFHERAIPCPYPHSSVDCDEILYYVEGNFTSRKGIGPGSISLHPMGLPHGPHPGTYEASIGSKTTSELAVMIDTFKPLIPTEHAMGVEDEGYNTGWVR